MKKVSILLVALFIGDVGLQAQQKRVVHVQGHPHEYLTKKANGRWKAPEPRLTDTPTDSVNPADIKCWIDEANLDTNLPMDSAILLVKFTGASIVDGDSILAWGYRWNSVDSYNDTLQVHAIDLIRAAANADQRLSFLIQYSGQSGHAVGGIGYNDANEECYGVPLVFDQKSTTADTLVCFHYTGTPNCDPRYNQVAVPVDSVTQVALAIANGSDDGFIVHPFGAEYGYPAYDFDYWKPTEEESYYVWQSGWYYGYWNFFIKNDWTGAFNYANLGITYQLIGNHTVVGYVFSEAYPAPSELMNGGYVPAPCDCRSCSETTQP
jgi:hypothetical protein